MKLTHLLSSLILMLILATGSNGQAASASVTTTFSNMEGVDGEKSSVVYSNRSGNPILRNSGFIAIGTFNLERAEIAALATASDLNDAFYQFGESSSFNSTENGAFQANASGDPAEAYDGGDTFDGAAVYLVIGDGSDLATSSEFLVWKSDQVFDGSGPIGGPSELILSVDSGDLIIGLNDKNTSDFSAIGGDVARAAFTTVAIDSGIDDHGDSTATATFVGANSTTAGNLKDGDDVDYFRVDLSEDGNLSLTVAGGSNIVLSIYDAEGGELVSSSSADQSVASDLASGTYYVRVVGDENTSDVDYSLESDFQEKIIDLDPASAGSYYGLVRYKNNGDWMGFIRIAVSEDGFYSGYLRGMFGYANSFKGEIKPNYSASIMINNVFGSFSNLTIQLSKNKWNNYIIHGQFQRSSETEPHHLFELQPAAYSKNKPVPMNQRGHYTMRMPSPSLSSKVLPAGDGFASGTLWYGGWWTITGRSNSGAKFTYSNPVLSGDWVPFFTRPEDNREALMGNVWFRDFEASDINGYLRYYRRSSTVGYYKEHFDVKLNLEGSKYKAPIQSDLPIGNFSIGNYNAVAKYYGGVFNGLYYPMTWKIVDNELKSELILDNQSTYSGYGQMNHRNGRFWGNYIVKTLEDNPATIKTYYRGVVLQKQGLVSGQAETIDNGVGRFSIVPSD